MNATGPCEAFFLSGDSFPKDDRIEAALAARLAPSFRAWINTHEMLRRLGTQDFNGTMEYRVPSVVGLIQSREEMEPPVLIGRSSGARVATLSAAHCRLKGIVCLGYPFRTPGGPIEPARTAHLADLRTPTLILQGLRDPYGALRIFDDYALSPSIEVHFVDCDHEFRIRPAQWYGLAQRIRTFLACLAASQRAA
ncbi:alpha/beta family hydrolase [Segnochrobactrum spirostomi]|uniref:KANL3/Tex30 alpha/beta hydrolase-like domain-containing protein n=1 Tax=Segnochrobactrum spirostomi TaxID=2608987 RepID=A0A6A7Y0D3_9HYPH|nr:alpha/beta family hydrolase [Segnochrobactrum spirostomi]MQT11847.1 hypothetical protein [Segnochrobactrum spirostomi]